MPPVSVIAETIEKIIHSHICNVFQMTANIVSLFINHRPAAKVKRHNEIGVRQIGIDNTSDDKHSAFHSIPLSDELALVKSVVQVVDRINVGGLCLIHPTFLVEHLSPTGKEENHPHDVQFAVPEVLVCVEHTDRVAGDR